MTRITYSASGGSAYEYINLTKDLSAMRFKNHQHTDDKGYVKGYICDLTIVAEAYQTAAVALVPNSWKMRNSFRKWHAYRAKMFRDAGVSRSEQGKYAHTMRPYFDTLHKARAELVPLLQDGAIAGGEWTYTEIAASPGFDGVAASGTGGIPMVDTYDLTILGENVVTGTASAGETTVFSSCGLIHSYNLDRMSEVTPAATEVLQGPNNPLALLRQGGGTTAGAVVDIAEDQELEAPPYDIGHVGDSVEYEFGPIFRCVPHVQQNTVINTDPVSGVGSVGIDAVLKMGVGTVRGVFIPAGIFSCRFAESTDTIFQVDVLAEVLCKDMASL